MGPGLRNVHLKISSPNESLHSKFRATPWPLNSALYSCSTVLGFKGTQRKHPSEKLQKSLQRGTKVLSLSVLKLMQENVANMARPVDLVMWIRQTQQPAMPTLVNASTGPGCVPK